MSSSRSLLLKLSFKNNTCGKTSSSEPAKVCKPGDCLARSFSFPLLHSPGKERLSTKKNLKQIKKNQKQADFEF